MSRPHAGKLDTPIHWKLRGQERLTVLNPQVDVDLVQDIAHAKSAGLGQQGETQVGRGLVVVQLVLGGAVGDEGVVVTAELAGHVPQTEDGAEDELGVVGGPVARRLLRVLGVSRGSGSRGRRRRERTRRRGPRRWEPSLAVDALG
jgi:hypothetical protein